MAPFSPEVRAFLRTLPRRRKAELHLHLEGAISTGTLLRLSGRHSPPLFPDRASFEKRQGVGGFRDFLDLYRDVCRCIKSPRDYASVARDLVRRLSRENIRYAEVYVSPAIIERMGLSWAAVWPAVDEVFRSYERESRGRKILVLLDSVRQWGPEAAQRVLDLHVASPWPRVAGFGLGGEECSIAAREFREVFDRVRSLSLAPLIHAGEWGDSSSVLEAVEELAPVRIAHGFRAASDEGLVRLLARRRIPLDICLQSNRKTRAVVEGERHPVLELIRAGVLVSLSTDDPGLFRATLLGEFVALARLGATVGELRGVLANGFRNGLSRKGTRQDERTRA